MVIRVIHMVTFNPVNDTFMIEVESASESDLMEEEMLNSEPYPTTASVQATTVWWTVRDGGVSGRATHQWSTTIIPAGPCVDPFSSWRWPVRVRWDGSDEHEPIDVSSLPFDEWTIDELFDESIHDECDEVISPLPMDGPESSVDYRQFSNNNSPVPQPPNTRKPAGVMKRWQLAAQRRCLEDVKSRLDLKPWAPEDHGPDNPQCGNMFNHS